jgi:hypothetical protein
MNDKVTVTVRLPANSPEPWYGDEQIVRYGETQLAAVKRAIRFILNQIKQNRRACRIKR